MATSSATPVLSGTMSLNTAITGTRNTERTESKPLYRFMRLRPWQIELEYRLPFRATPHLSATLSEYPSYVLVTLVATLTVLLVRCLMNIPFNSHGEWQRLFWPSCSSTRPQKDPAWSSDGHQYPSHHPGSYVHCPMLVDRSLTTRGGRRTTMPPPPALLMHSKKAVTLATTCHRKRTTTYGRCRPEYATERGPFPETRSSLHPVAILPPKEIHSMTNMKKAQWPVNTTAYSIIKHSSCPKCCALREPFAIRSSSSSSITWYSSVTQFQQKTMGCGALNQRRASLIPEEGVHEIVMRMTTDRRGPSTRNCALRARAMIHGCTCSISSWFWICRILRHQQLALCPSTSM